MKQIKFLSMLLFAAVMSFSFCACSSDDDDDNGGGDKDKYFAYNVEVKAGEILLEKFTISNDPAVQHVAQPHDNDAYLGDILTVSVTPLNSSYPKLGSFDVWGDSDFLKFDKATGKIELTRVVEETTYIHVKVTTPSGKSEERKFQITVYSRNGKSELNDTGSELSWTEIAHVQGYSIYTTHKFGYKGNTVTSYQTITEFPGEPMAQAALAELKNDKETMEGVESCRLDGNKLTVVYKLGNGSPFEGLTVDIVRSMYEGEPNVSYIPSPSPIAE